jgi:hypothetical protein
MRPHFRYLSASLVSLYFFGGLPASAQDLPAEQVSGGDEGAEVALGVEELAEDHFAVQRWFLAAAFAGIDGVEGRPQVRFVPIVGGGDDGREGGVAVFGVRVSSPLAALGLRNGDDLLSLDGRPVTLELLRDELGAPSRQSYTVDIERRGRERTLRYDLLDTLPEPDDIAEAMPERVPSDRQRLAEPLAAWMAEHGIEGEPALTPRRRPRPRSPRLFLAEVALGEVARVDDVPAALEPLRTLPGWARVIEVRASPVRRADNLAVVAVLEVEDEGAAGPDGEPGRPQQAVAPSPIDVVPALLAGRDALVAEWAPELRVTALSVGERVVLAGWVPDLDGLAVLLWWADGQPCPTGRITLEFDESAAGGYDFSLAWADPACPTP